MAEHALIMPFSIDPSGNIRVTSDQGTIWSTRVRVAVGTIIGERIMRPEYGTKIGAASFETVSTMEETIRREVNRVFSEQLPLLTLKDIELNHNERTNTLTAEITYELPNRTLATTKAGIMVVSSTNPPYEETV